MSKKFFLSEISFDEFKADLRQLIIDVVQNTRDTDSTSDVLTIDELCREFKMAKQTVYRKTSRKVSKMNMIPHSKVGKKLFFSRKKIKQWMGM